MHDKMLYKCLKCFIKAFSYDVYFYHEKDWQIFSKISYFELLSKCRILSFDENVLFVYPLWRLEMKISYD